jgi:hypothetical protein
LPGFKSAEEWRKSHKVVVTDTHARNNT